MSFTLLVPSKSVNIQLPVPSDWRARTVRPRLLTRIAGGLLAGERKQLRTRHLLRGRHPKIKLRGSGQHWNDTPSAAKAAIADHAVAARALQDVGHACPVSE